MLLILIGASWIAGVLLGSVWVPDIWLALLATFGCAVVSIMLRLRGAHYLPPLCLAVVLLGTVRFGVAMLPLEHLDLASFNDGSPVLLRGTVAQDPDVRDGWMSLTLNDIAVSDGHDFRVYAGAALVRVGQWADYCAGDRLELVGSMESPPQLDGFSYRDYLLRRGIVSIVNYPEIKMVIRGESAGLWSALDALRDRLAATLASSLPEPPASLAQGLLLGVRSNIVAGVLESFSRTSTSHILAVSGFNVAMVAAALIFITRRLLRQGPSTMVAIAGVVVYTLLVGASPSAVRAAIMGSMVILGGYYGRQSHLVTSLLLAASLMVLLDPFVLWDVGFQLSFLATGGLGVLAPMLSSRLGVLPTVVREPLALTLAAQVATGPVLAVNFNQVSLVALPANLLVLPAVPLATLLSGCTAFAGIIWPALGAVIGCATGLILTYVFLVVEVLATLPWAALSVGQFPVALAGVCYLGLGIVALFAGRHRVLARLPLDRPVAKRVGMVAVVILAIVAAVSWLGVLRTPTDDLSVSFLNVGQGDAILIRTPHRVVLIDGGPKPAVLADALGRRLPFWRRDVDLVVLTHSDADHVTGLVEVARRYHIGRVLQPESAETGGAYGAWLAVIRGQGVPVSVATVGQVIHLDDDVDLTVLYPRARTLVEPNNAVAADNANEDSVVLRLTCRGFSFLLTGDAGPTVQRALLDSGVDLRSVFLKVPHHGANGALLPEFLPVVDPRVAVISVGSGNAYGHPSSTTLNQLAGREVYRTDLNGSVEVVIRGAQCWVRTDSP